MKNGFTLIELLGVISLISILILVAVPSLNDSSKAAKQNEKDSFNDTVSQACVDFLEVNSEEDIYKDFFDRVNGSLSLKLKTLISEGYLKTNLKNPYHEDESVTGDDMVEATITNDGVVKCVYQNND